MWTGDGVVAVSAGCEYVGGTRGSCIMSSAEDVKEMSVGHWVRGVGVVCEMYVFGSDGVGGERIVFSIYQSCVNRGSVGRVSVVGLQRCRMCRGE